MKVFRAFLVFILLLLLSVTSVAMAQTTGPAVPETLTTFTITPGSAPIGTNVEFSSTYSVASAGVNDTAFCFYFAAADAALWNANFTGMASDAFLTYVKDADANYCPPIAGFGRFGFYTTDTTSAIFDDTVHQTVTVPAIATGNKIIAMRQYEGVDCFDEANDGGADVPVGANCPLVSTRSITNFIVQAAPAVVYVGLAGCEGNSPCYTSLASAYAAVAAGGTIRLVASMPAENLTISKDLTLLDYDGTGAVTGAAGAEALGIGDGATVVIDSPTINAGAATNVLAMSGASLTVKGATLNGGALAFDISLGTVQAYANNINGYTTGVSLIGGTFDGRHNWWGVGATAPGVGDADAFAYRLGADVVAWGEGALGGASISADTATGTGVIVSHGRGDSNAPFGKSTVADGNTQCSDYYDFFTAPGASAGNWYVEVPVDAGAGCDATYNSRQVFAYDLTGAGAPNPACVSAACWEDLKDTVVETLVQLGRPVGIRWSTASTLDLGGTPIVAGNQDGNDPTAIVVESLTASASIAWLPMVLLSLALILTAGLFVGLRRRPIG